MWEQYFNEAVNAGEIALHILVTAELGLGKTLTATEIIECWFLVNDFKIRGPLAYAVPRLELADHVAALLNRFGFIRARVFAAAKPTIQIIPANKCASICRASDWRRRSAPTSPSACCYPTKTTSAH